MNKNYIKSVIYGYEVRIAQVIVEGVINRASKRDVMRTVRELVLHLSLSNVEKNQLWLFATSFYRHTIASANRETDPDLRIAKVYTVLRKDNKLLEGVKNSVANDIEFRVKHDEIRQMVTGDNIFYMCTSHHDCAKGHLAYQGKVYVIARWRDRIGDDQELLARLESYIRDHQIMTVEEVTAEPIWLVTRRNCRHRLIPVSIDSVLSGFKGDLRHEDKNKDMSYAEIQYRGYYDRLKMLEHFQKVFEQFGEVPDQMITDLKNTRKLCRAWKEDMKKGG